MLFGNIMRKRLIYNDKLSLDCTVTYTNPEVGLLTLIGSR
jgi:hypothetical protein